MSWKMIGKPITTAEMGGTTISQRIVTPNKRYLLAGVQAGIVFYGNPSYTNLAMRLYHDSAGSPGALIATSKTYTKSQIQTLAHAYKFIGFGFDPHIPIQASAAYHLVLYATGYTGNSASHIAWRLSYPDPQFPTGIDLDAAHADNHPFEMTMVGASLP